MKLNIANPSTGQMKVPSPPPQSPNAPALPIVRAWHPPPPHVQVIECDDDRKLRNFYDKRINQVGCKGVVVGFGALSCFADR